MCHCAAVTRRQRHHPKDSPAAGLGIVSPSVKARSGGSTDLMNFYATSYAVAYGPPRFRPCLGHHTGTGYVSNNHSAISCLLCPRGAAEGHCQDTATSTTTEHFKPFWLPNGRSLLPWHVHQPESGYLQESSLSCPHTRGVSPQHTWLLQGPPRASREHGTESRCAGPAQPDVLQKMTIGAKEQSGFTRATPRSDSILPVLPAQPLGVSITTTDYLPSVHSHGGETLLALPAGSERGNGFSRQVPGCLGMADHALNPPPSPQEPLGFTINHGQYVTPPRTRPLQCQPGVGRVQPGWRDPWGASSPSVPAGSAPTTTPPGWGTSLATGVAPPGVPASAVAPSSLGPPQSLGAQGEIKTPNSLPGHNAIVTFGSSRHRGGAAAAPSPYFGGCLHPEGWQEDLGGWGGGRGCRLASSRWRAVRARLSMPTLG
ncbi:stabilizer of axonemal microtubules 4 [Haliaeetus albicilla]|uniref:stabilizer of axonemal microtubules 4 n=1 Tax=Haliaeetus albicilla TaxID=8969 RepID=UPI0037E90AD1